MDTIKGLVEAIEAEFGEAIVARDESLAVLLDVRGLGPPDLVWLQKNSKSSSLITTQGEAKGYYHHTIGRDVSSSAAVAAYFAELNATIEPMTFMQGLWYSSETIIERGFYCCYDPFTRQDVRCELCVPGGVMCGALDPNGQIQDVTAELWGHCQLAGFLRSELLDPELTSQASTTHPIRRFPLDPLKSSPHAEVKLLEVVHSMYSKGTLPTALEYITFDPGRGCTAEHMDLVLSTLLNYFIRRQRIEQGVDFFIKLTQAHAPASIYVASLQRLFGRPDDSLDILGKALEHSPDDPQIAVALGLECLYCGQVEAATKLARRAIRICGSPNPLPPDPHKNAPSTSTSASQAPPPPAAASRPMMQPRAAWLLLARCYIKLGLYALAMVTLNVMPPPPHMTMSEEEMIFVVVPTRPKTLTKPSVAQRVETEEEAALKMDRDDAMAEGSSDYLNLAGAALVTRDPMDAYPWPDVCPYRSTRVSLMGAYAVLQDLVAAVGWGVFLDLRGRLFLMHDEAAYAARPPSMSAEEAQIKRERRRREQLLSASLVLEGGEGGVNASSLLDYPEDEQDDYEEEEEEEEEEEKEEEEEGVPKLPLSSVVVEVKKPPNDLSSLTLSDSFPLPSNPSPLALVPTSSVYSSLWDMVFGYTASPSTQSAEDLNSNSNGRQGEVVRKAGPLGESTEKPHEPYDQEMGMKPNHGAEGEGAGGGAGGEGYLDDGEEEDEEEEGEEGTVMSWSGQVNTIAMDRWAAVTGGTMAPSLRRGEGSRSLSSELASGVEEDQEEGDEEEEEGGGHSGGLMKTKRLSARWLDELVSALWQDLQCYLDWATEDTRLERTTGNSLAGLLLGHPPIHTPTKPPPSNHPNQSSNDQGGAGNGNGNGEVLLPRVTPGDWMRRGMLAERLFHEEQALLAFKCACLTSDAIAAGTFSSSGLTVSSASKFATASSSSNSSTNNSTAPINKSSSCLLLAWTSLMRVATLVGDVPTAVQAMHRVTSWHEDKASATSGTLAACPLSVVCSIHSLLTRQPPEGEGEGGGGGDQTMVSIRERLADLGKVHPTVSRELKAASGGGGGSVPSPAGSHQLQA